MWPIAFASRELVQKVRTDPSGACDFGRRCGGPDGIVANDRFTAAARTATRTSLRPGSGSGSSPTVTTSGPPWDRM
jgi:hypothetical protein